MNGNGATVHQPDGRLIGQKRRVGVVYWDWYDQGNHRVGAVEKREGELVHVEIEGALGVKSLDITMSAALALAAALIQVNVPPTAP
jgi:hypothetical protein